MRKDDDHKLVRLPSASQEWTDKELRGWCLPQNVLLPEELPRAQEFVDLFRQQLKVYAQGSLNPDPVQRLAARRRAVVIWEIFVRATDDIQGATLRRRKLETDHGRRQELYAASELRQKQVGLALEELDSCDRFARVAAGLIESEAIPERSSG